MFHQVDISGVDLSKFEDAYFAKSKAKKVKSADGMLQALFVLVSRVCKVCSYAMHSQHLGVPCE
jgi:hypothetical protein